MVQILDSTLREGEQTPGVYFDSHIKMAIAHLLDKVGVDFIETGHPAVSKEINEAVVQIAGSGLNATVAAHSRTMKTDVLQAIDAGVGFIGIFYCVSDERLNHVYKKSLTEVISQVDEVIRFAKKNNPKIMIRYTPEDTVRSNFLNVVKTASAAARAGADIISIADTTGYMIPSTDRSMYDYVKSLKTELAKKGAHPKIAVHCHNDRGLALANALDAYRAGADIIDTSVLSVGERAGIVDLAQFLTVVSLDFEDNRWDLTKLDALYDLVSEHANLQIPVNFPVMGQNAFSHCAGLHTQAAVQDPKHYQSIDPKIFGRDSTICLDNMSGRFSVQYMLKKIGKDDQDNALIDCALQRVKEVGRKGKFIQTDEFRHIVSFCEKQLKRKNGNNN